MKIFNAFVLLILTFNINKAKHFKNIENNQIDKISKTEIDIFFSHNIEPVSINDLIIPLNELKGSYKKYSFKLFQGNDLRYSDSINYSAISKKILSKNKKLINTEINNFGKIFFKYDKNNTLVKRESFNNENQKWKTEDFLYNSKYSEMYEVETNNYTQNDTLKFYTFNISKKPVRITSFFKKNKLKMLRLIEYNNKGLIQSIAKEYNSNDGLYYKTTAKYNYKFNKKGDWIKLTIYSIETKDSRKNEIIYLCERTLKD